jgi:hypothetical protein
MRQEEKKREAQIITKSSHSTPVYPIEFLNHELEVVKFSSKDYYLPYEFPSNHT